MCTGMGCLVDLMWAAWFGFKGAATCTKSSGLSCAVHMLEVCAVHMPWKGCPCWWYTLSHVEGRFQLVPGSRASVELVELASS